MTLEEDGVPVQQMCARRRQLARLLAEDVFTSSVMKMRQLSFSKPLHAATWETTACACSQVAAFRNLLLENRRLSSSRDCVHLAFAGPLRFLLAKAPLHPENESASLFADHQAVVSPFDARSVGESTPRLFACQARSCIRSKKFSKTFLSSCFAATSDPLIVGQIAIAVRTLHQQHCDCASGFIPSRPRVSHERPDRRLDRIPGRARDCSTPRSPERSCRGRQARRRFPPARRKTDT